MNLIGRQYKTLQINLYWKVYYGIFGVPFMSAHLVYDLLVNNCDFKKSDLIFDYGTGDGLFLNQLTKEFGLIGFGVDRLPERINKAQKVSDIQHLNNSFICSNFDDIRVKEKFDKVLCLDVLEHLENPYMDLKRISKVTKDGGTLIIQTPRDGDKKYVFKDEKQEFTYGTDVHKRKGFYLEEIDTLLSKSGFKMKYWQSSFPPFSQIMYELLEMIRLKSKIIYSVLILLAYPLCCVDFALHKKSKSNGLFIIAIKTE